MNSIKKGLLVSALALLVIGWLPHTLTAQNVEDDLQALLDEMTATDALTGDAGVQDEAMEVVDKEHDSAEDVLDTEWTYSTGEAISVEDITSDSATIKTTEVLYNGKPVAKYKVYLSDKTLPAVQDYDQIVDVTVGIEKVEGRMVYLKVTDLAPNKKYFVIVSPVHPTDPTAEPLTMISDEVSFTTEKGEIATDTKVFTNVSYTFEGNKVTLTWDPSDLADTAEIYIKYKDSDGDYTRVGTPKLSDGQFVFSVENAGSYFLKMSALNGQGDMVGQEHIQTVKIDEIVKPPVEEVVQKAPKVGPTSDMIIGLMIFAILIYLIYRFRVIKVRK